MSYFLALSGSPTKFSKSGFLLRTVGSILEQRAIEFRVNPRGRSPRRGRYESQSDQSIHSRYRGGSSTSLSDPVAHPSDEGKRACSSFDAVGATRGRLVFGQAGPFVCHWRIAWPCPCFGACTPARACSSRHKNGRRPSTYSRRKLDHIWQRSPSPFPGRRARGRSRCRSHLRRNQVERAQRILS
jgi:hypothetical protein